MPPPQAIVFDVNETLSDMSPMTDRFAEVGAPPLAQTWFASVLRDGFAATVTGRQERFAVLATENLRVLLTGQDLDRDVTDAVEHIMAGFMSLPLHDDVVPGVRALHAAGIRLCTLTNGSVEVAEQLLERAGIRDRFEALLSVEQAEAWKPARVAYEYAVVQCCLDLSDVMLVAVHPWDIDGAARAGMQTAWLRREGREYPSFAAHPDHTVESVTDLADLLAG